MLYALDGDNLTDEPKLYRVKYKIYNYVFTANKTQFAEVETKEEIVSDLGLSRIKDSLGDMGEVIEIKPLNIDSLPPFERVIEYIDEKGYTVGVLLKKRK